MRQKKMNLKESIRKHYRHILFSVLLSAAFIATSFAILILRVGFPYHRHIAIIFYLVSWLFYVRPFIRKENLQRIRKNRHMRFLGRNIISVTGTIIFLLILYFLYIVFPVDHIRFTDEGKQILEDKIADDEKRLQGVIFSTERALENFKSKGWGDLTIESSGNEKVLALKSDFTRIIDHIYILDRFTEEYKYFYQINMLKDAQLHRRAFIITYSAYLTKYKLIYDINKEIGQNRYAEGILNERLDEIHGPGIYSLLRSKMSSPKVIIKVNTGRAYLRYLSSRGLDEDAAFVQYDKQMYSEMFGNTFSQVRLGFDHGLYSFEKNTMDRWLPVQKDIANLLGDTRYTKRGDYFITAEQIQEVYEMIEPGDIMFQRRNWYVSNIGMPGFWTHSAIYTGTLEEMDDYFSEESLAVFGIPLSEHIRLNHKKFYEDKKRLGLEGYSYTTIEAKSDGILMLPMEISATVDYLAVIRPKLSKKDKMLAIVEAIGHYGKAYDYDFDFNTEETLVCSELVYKAYLPNPAKDGLAYEPYSVAGRVMLAPNDMVKTFDERYGTDSQQNDFVLFLDGNEKTGKAGFSDVEAFRESWKRPKNALFLD